MPSATHAICWEFKKEWFVRAPKLRVLATPAAGRELLPSDDEMPAGVVRVNGAFHGAIMCETVLACIFAHARGLYRAYDFQRGGVLWPRSEMSPFCSLVAGTHAVILGYGKIGRTIGARLEALGVAVTGIRRRNVQDLVPSLKNADWLIVALLSDTGTDNIVNRRVLAALPRRAVVVNVGRGNAVDEDALADALRTLTCSRRSRLPNPLRSPQTCPDSSVCLMRPRSRRSTFRFSSGNLPKEGGLNERALRS